MSENEIKEEKSSKWGRPRTFRLPINMDKALEKDFQKRLEKKQVRTFSEYMKKLIEFANEFGF